MMLPPITVTTLDRARLMGLLATRVGHAEEETGATREATLVYPSSAR